MRSWGWGWGGARPAHVEVFALQSGAELAVAVAHEQARLIPPPTRKYGRWNFFSSALFLFFKCLCVVIFVRPVELRQPPGASPREKQQQ